VIFGSQVHGGFTTIREMKYTSQHCFDKTVDDKMALIVNAVFRIAQNLVNKVTFIAFMGAIAYHLKSTPIS